MVVMHSLAAYMDRHWGRVGKALGRLRSSAFGEPSGLAAETFLVQLAYHSLNSSLCSSLLRFDLRIVKAALVSTRRSHLLRRSPGRHIQFAFGQQVIQIGAQ